MTEPKTKVMFYQEKTKANTCPECGGFLMLPYFPHGFNNDGITQCSDCDYSKLTKMIPWDKAKKDLESTPEEPE